MLGLSDRVYRNTCTGLQRTEDEWKDYWKVTRFSSQEQCLVAFWRSDRCTGSGVLRVQGNITQPTGAHFCLLLFS